jgi:hypothetical protein
MALRFTVDGNGSDDSEYEFELWMIVADADGDFRLIGFDVSSKKPITTDKIANLDLEAGTARTVYGTRYRLVKDGFR